MYTVQGRGPGDTRWETHYCGSIQTQMESPPDMNAARRAWSGGRKRLCEGEEKRAKEWLGESGGGEAEHECHAQSALASRLPQWMREGEKASGQLG